MITKRDKMMITGNRLRRQRNILFQFRKLKLPEVVIRDQKQHIADIERYWDVIQAEK